VTWAEVEGEKMLLLELAIATFFAAAAVKWYTDESPFVQLDYIVFALVFSMVVRLILIFSFPIISGFFAAAIYHFGMCFIGCVVYDSYKDELRDLLSIRR